MLVLSRIQERKMDLNAQKRNKKWLSINLLKLGFISCNKSVGLTVLNGEDQLRPSCNPWDWPGPGGNFWELNPYRALEYATECASGKQKFSGIIKTCPARSKNSIPS